MHRNADKREAMKMSENGKCRAHWPQHFFAISNTNIWCTVGFVLCTLRNTEWELCRCACGCSWYAKHTKTRELIVYKWVNCIQNDINITLVIGFDKNLEITSRNQLFHSVLFNMAVLEHFLFNFFLLRSSDCSSGCFVCLLFGFVSLFGVR